MTGLDLFAGCGGASLGLARAGVRMVAHYERDPDACATLRAAFGGYVKEGDLSTVNPLLLPDVDLWWASPPCQPFSAAGKHGGQADTRDGYPHVLRLLRDAAARPVWLVLENVPALLWQRHRVYWADIVRQLRKHLVWVDFRILDAADYGVPQHRRRVITVCGPRPIAWPAPTHGPGLLPYRTMSEALGLTNEQRVIGGGHNPNHAGDKRKHNDLTDRPSTTIAATHGGGAGNAGPWVEPMPDWWHRASSPSRTIGASRNASIKPGTGRRRLTIEECGILQDLEGHPIQGRTKTSRYRQVGNAVPPRLAEVVARSIIQGGTP